MDIYHLPGDIFPGSDCLKDDIIVHEYTAPVGSFKGKSILQKNAVSLVLQGEKTMRFAEKTVITNDHEFHFLSAGNCLVTMDIAKEKTFSSILIFFDDAVLVNFHLKYKDHIASLQSDKSAARQPYISIRKDDFIRQYITSLGLLLKNKRPMSSVMKQLKFDELMLYLLDKHADEVLAFGMVQNNGAEAMQLRKVVETNISGNLTIEELAFLCNMSVSTFKRNFTKVYGTSPNKWMIQKRMEIAADLLRNPDEQPGSVYHKVGYENHSSFTQSFKQIYGLTPSEYKAQQTERLAIV